MSEKITFNVLQTNPDGTKAEVEISFSPYELAKHISEEALAEMLGDYMNCFCNEYQKGQRIGERLQHQHRTLQGSVARFVLGILVGIGNTEYFDARNEKAVAMGKQLKAMIEKGELKMGYMI